ncbi:DUF5689 domain-containing protein [Flavobacterium sp. XGLA_31]|uniref:DUF5689 domain-containing protein n=1 Tax=Flavobacterium sp. XGLA_31 TaxID=3447666 RepID=UPI003F3B36E3
MKTTFLKSALLVALSAGVFSSCVKDDNYSTPELQDCGGSTLVKNREVSQILATPTVAQHVNIVDGVSDVIEAYVTSSDIGGNFFKSISFQTKPVAGQEVKAFSIPVDASNTFIDYEPGRKVLIKMDGLYTDNPTSGPIGMRIGGLYVSSSGYPSVGRMPEADFRAAVQPTCEKIDEDKLLPINAAGVPTPVTISDITSSNAYLNRLVELDNVMFDDASIQSPAYYNVANDIGGATNLHIVDVAGGSVIFRTSSYANFAAKSVLKGTGKIRGVLTKYGSDFQFIARSQNDIQLSNDVNDRFIIIKEGFDASQGSWTTFSVTGAQTWQYSSTFGNPGGMMKMSGYSGGNQNNEDWLISPANDLSTWSMAYMSFDNAFKFDGNPVEVYVSNNYPGTGSPYAAGVTWTQLTGAQLSAGNYAYVNSGSLNISDFVGAGNTNVRVAIKYTSTTTAASTWEIDNVTLTGKH